MNSVLITSQVDGECMLIIESSIFLRKNNFSLPFMDQMLEYLTSKSFYCFLDGYNEYYHIVINPEDQQKKTTLIIFNFYNAPAAFQIYMMRIFSVMILNFL